MTNIKNSLSLGERIRQAREQAGLSQSELGKVLKLSDKTVSAYEVDRAEPSIETLKSISRATSTPVTYFIGEEAKVEDLLTLKLTKIEQELAEIRTLLKKGR